MKLDIKQMQDIVTEMLKATVAVCEKNHITYYCQAGTVLGTVRHGGTIPWDHDADIIIPNDQLDRFIECAQRDLPDKFYVDYFKVDAKSLRQFPRIGLKGYTTNRLHLDVFRLIGLPDNKQEQLDMVEEAHLYTNYNVLMRKPIWKLFLKGKFARILDKLTGKREAYIWKFDELCNRYPYEKANNVMNPSGKYGAKNIFAKAVYGEGKMMQYTDFQVRIPDETDFYLRQYYGDYMRTPDKEYIDKELNRIFNIK